MTQKLTVIAIGPDRPELLTLMAAEALRKAPALLLRTARHGVAAWLAEQGTAFDALDALYDGAEDFDALNEAAADEIVRRLSVSKGLCYAVADPAADETVAALRRRSVPMAVVAGVTQADCARAAALASGLPVSGGAVTVAAVDMQKRRIDPSLPLLVTEIGSRLSAGEVKLALLDVYPPEMTVLVNGSACPLEALDRQKRYDHLSYAFIPESPMAARNRYTFSDLLDVMARLRRPGDGCPWDLEQTNKSLREYIIEEAYELVDAIDQGDDDRVADELGDVLLQVVFHAQVAKEHGAFAIGDVTTAICHKMITRHAHIFGDVRCETADDVLKSWEAIKKKEKGLLSAADSMRDIPGHLPSLMRAAKVQKKARQVGFDWDSALPALEKVLEEADEVRAEIEAGRDPEGELGDLLFAAVNAARLAGAQPELALNQATEKFVRRFEKMERAILTDGKQLKGMTLQEMDAYWDAVKRGEKEES